MRALLQQFLERILVGVLELLGMKVASLGLNTSTSPRCEPRKASSTFSWRRNGKGSPLA